MLGGGGAERAASSWAEHSTKCRPDDYPLDQFWKGEAPKQDYNYMHVGSEGQPTRFTLNRFRPWSAEALAIVEPFGSSQ